MSVAQEAHQIRLQKLLESGQLTPAPSPTPADDEDAAAAHTGQMTLPKSSRRFTRRTHPKPNLLGSVSESGQILPDSINYIVAVSSRSPDVGLENDHNLHCLCSFPTHQAAYDWIAKHRLALARHYLQDPQLSGDELSASAAAYDELYLGENTSMEILQVPQFLSAHSAPPPEGALFSDHFASKLSEEEEERKHMADKEEEEKEEGKEKESAAAAAATSPSGGKGKKKAANNSAEESKGAKRRKT